MNLHSLTDATRRPKSYKRVGRGIGSGKGKTCGRGGKGMGARSGYQTRAGYEGGQFRLYMKLPIRGFNNAQFRKELDGVNLSQIDKLYNDGEEVSLETLREKGFLRGKSHGIKILGNGVLTKKVTIKAKKISQKAREELHKSNITFSIDE